MATVIDGKRYSWTQPVCPTCYAGLTGREPHKLVEDYRSSEICCVCGKATGHGIYYRIDPAEVPHPTPEAEDG